MPGQIAPSMMCCDAFDMEKTLAAFEKGGIEYLHIDVMDGVFVPNFTLGTDYVKMLRRHSKIPMDIHLMITDPEYKLDWFDIQPGDYVSVHPESTPHIHRAIAKIKQKGAKAMLALNPGTPLSVAQLLAPELDAVLIMTVDPGFAGQSLIVPMLDKIVTFKRWICENGYDNIEIEVDGNVSLENAKKMRSAGADIFVAGSSSIFNPAKPMDEAIADLRASIQ